MHFFVQVFVIICYVGMMFFRKVYDICIVHVCPFDLYFSWIKIYILVYQYSPIEYIEV